MSNKAQMYPVHIKYKGIYDFAELWRLIGDWFESKSFEVVEGKAKHKMGTFGEEFETIMHAWRNVTDYFRFEMVVYSKYWDGNYVEVVKGGQKKKMIKARLYMRIGGTLVMDYSDRYDRSNFGKGLGKFMDKFVMRWPADAVYSDQLHYKIHELMNVVKEYLNVEAKGSEFADMW